jgi:hypothetical protein
MGSAETLGFDRSDERACEAHNAWMLAIADKTVEEADNNSSSTEAIYSDLVSDFFKLFRDWRNGITTSQEYEALCHQTSLEAQRSGMAQGMILSANGHAQEQFCVLEDGLGE